MTIPVVDERVKYVGVSYLRSLNAKALRELADLVVVQVEEKPVAVIIPIAIYMEIQAALWPSSLIPSLEDFFKNAEDDEHPGFGALMPDGPDLPAPSVPRKCSKCGAVANPSIGGGVFDKIGDEPVVCPRCANGSPQVHAIGTDMTPRGKCPTPRVDDHAPIVFDDLDEEPSTLEAENNPPRKSALQRGVENERYLERHGASATLRKIAGEYDQKRAAIEGVCGHCGKPNDKPLCGPCFMAGHRAGNCQQCGEAAR